MASEPLFDKHENRTDEHWVQLFRDRKGYHVEFGDDRGTLKTSDGESIDDVIEVYQSKVEEYDMEEDSQKEVDRENQKLSLEDIVRLYFEEGDYLNEGMDDALDRLKTDANIRHSYKNIYEGSNGFLAKVNLRRGSEKLTVFVDYDGTNPHMVREIKSA